jgi:hypothetical protein
VTASFDRMATVSAETRRNPPAVAGKIAAPVLHLSGVRILRPMPVSAQIAEFYRLQSPRETFVTYTEETDVREGDVLVAQGVEYRVTAVGEWDGSLEVILGRVKGT